MVVQNSLRPNQLAPNRLSQANQLLAHSNSKKTGKRTVSNESNSSDSSDGSEEGEIKNPNMYLKMNKYESSGKHREKYRDKKSKKDRRNDKSPVRERVRERPKLT